MTEVMERNDRAQYQADLERASSLGGPPCFHALRERGAARFAEMDFPHYKEDAWQFTTIAPIVKTPFRSVMDTATEAASAKEVARHLYDDFAGPQFVFVDGVYVDALSRASALPDGVVAGSLAQHADGNETIASHLGQHAETTSAFIALNEAFVQDGAFVHVPEGVTVETPIHFLFLSTGVETAASYPRNLFVLEASSEATIVETHAGLSDNAPYLSNVVEECVVGDNATLHRLNIVEEGAQGFHLVTSKVVQGRDSNLKSFSITLTGRIVRNELDVVLGGENATADMRGLYLNDGDRVIDNFMHITHAASKCYSRMAYKGVLDGASSAVFTGKVLVPQDSQQTDSDQLNNNLLLSGEASIDTKPQLEIFADDVKCTHGATIGGFPSELLFYFQSRGMTADMAQAILTYGFASEIVDAIGVDTVRDRLSRYVFDQYSPR